MEPGPTDADMNAVPGLLDRLAPMMAPGRVGKDAGIATRMGCLAGPESSCITGAALTVASGCLA